MQIPDTLHPFEKPTLIVVTDSVQAKLWRADGRTLEGPEQIDAQTGLEQDTEHVSGQSPGGAHFAENRDQASRDSREHLYHALSKTLMDRLHKQEFEVLVFTVPEEHENELKETLHVDLLKRALTFVPKHLTNDDPLDIVAHVQEAIG